MAISIAPKTHTLTQQRTGKRTYDLLVAEALDNSFDALATTVSVTINRTKIEIVDNGIGLTRKNITAPFTEGEHAPMASTALGQFGAGITLQGRKHGDTMEIDTVSDGIRLRLQADWPAVKGSGNWELDDPVETKQHGPSGTKVTIGKLIRAPTQKEILDVQANIAKWFYPAIAAGRPIFINEQMVPLLKEPEHDKSVDAWLDFSGDRRAHVHGGLLKNPGSSKLWGVHVSIGHRVVMPECRVGCGDYNGIDNIFIRVELSGKWKLTTFKDGVDDISDIEERVLEILSPLLVKAEQNSMDVVVQQIYSELCDALGDKVVRPIAAKRLDRKGAKLGRQGIVTGPRSDGGPARGKTPNGRFLIDLVPGKEKAEEIKIGVVDRRGKIPTVRIALENNYIKEVWGFTRRARISVLKMHVLQLYHESDTQRDIDFSGAVWADYERQPEFKDVAA